MDSPAPAQPNASSQPFRLLPGVSGLVVAAVVTFSASAPPTHYANWTGLLAFAFERILTVALSCVLTVAILSAVLAQKAGLDLHLLLVQTSRAAIWLAPLAFLLRVNSPWTLAAVAVFTILATLSVRPPDEYQPNPEDALLSSLHLDNSPLSPRFRPQLSILTALCAQAGILAFFAGHAAAGAIIAGAASCAWTWWSLANTKAEDSPSQSHSLSIALLALAFTVAALIPYLRGSTGFGLGSSHRYAARVGTSGSGSRLRVVTHLVTDSSGTTAEGNAGIVLWPEKQLHTQLVAPSPVDLSMQPTPGRNANPLVIPFDGVYWFFKAPDVRPPKTSRQAQASPETVEIRSTDRRPLSIEAHDYLGSRIDLACCSRIQIAIRNADRYPDTVSLELILVDTSQPGQPSQSLGRMSVKSTRPWRIHERPQPVTENLIFAIPARASLRHFDEVKIVFRLDPARADAGARIAIDHLVLIPRGL